jgi:hypothetical protein
MQDQTNGQEETIKLTATQMEMVGQADGQFKHGEGYTPTQVREMARKRTKAWLDANHSRPPA